MNRIKPELLAPAGDLEKVKWAIIYGADAVYLGGREYGLRANAKNLSIEEIKEASEFVHSYNKRIYVTVNIVFHNEDINNLKDYLIELDNAKVDAIIISDPLIIDIVKDLKLKLEIHLSTQQSTLNHEAFKYWKKEGINRIVLARETSKEDIVKIKNESNIEIETFIHGAMCVGYSGRCVLSNYLTNRDSNRGGCSQICRWNFDLYDKDKKKIDTKEEFSMAVKDLSMVKYIKDLMDIGVSSFKIEGRMRSVYYIATVLNIYRKIIDDYYDNKEDNNIEEEEYELYRCANREAIPQYFISKPGIEGQYYLGRNEMSNKDFLAIVLDYNEIEKEITLEQRNYFKVGDIVTIYGPNTKRFDLKIEYIKEENSLIEMANHPLQIVKIKSNMKVNKYDIMRINFNIDNNKK
jgi:putative protease